MPTADKVSAESEATPREWNADGYELCRGPEPMAKVYIKSDAKLIADSLNSFDTLKRRVDELTAVRDMWQAMYLNKLPPEVTEPKCLECSHSAGVSDRGYCNIGPCLCRCTYAQPEPATPPLTEKQIAEAVVLNCGAQLGESPDILTFNRALLVAEIASAINAAPRLVERVREQDAIIAELKEVVIDMQRRGVTANNIQMARAALAKVEGK